MYHIVPKAVIKVKDKSINRRGSKTSCPQIFTNLYIGFNAIFKFFFPFIIKFLSNVSLFGHIKQVHIELQISTYTSLVMYLIFR